MRPPSPPPTQQNYSAITGASSSSFCPVHQNRSRTNPPPFIVSSSLQSAKSPCPRHGTVPMHKTFAESNAIIRSLTSPTSATTASVVNTIVSGDGDPSVISICSHSNVTSTTAQGSSSIPSVPVGYVHSINRPTLQAHQSTDNTSEFATFRSEVITSKPTVYRNQPSVLPSQPMFDQRDLDRCAARLIAERLAAGIQSPQSPPCEDTNKSLLTKTKMNKPSSTPYLINNANIVAEDQENLRDNSPQVIKQFGSKSNSTEAKSAEKKVPTKKKLPSAKLKARRHTNKVSRFSWGWRLGGIRDRQLKRLTHPLERSVAGFFVITLFFTLLAIVSGVPLVLFLCTLLPVAFGVRALLNCDCIRSTRLDERRCTPLERYWLQVGLRNNCKRGRALCLLYVDEGLSVAQLRDLVMSRLIQRPGMERFRWVLRYKGILRTPFWQRIPLSEFDIERQISGGLVCNSRSQLRKLLLHLWHQPLNPERRPAWHIHHVRLPAQRKVALVLRIHQSLCDGLNLTKILLCHLVDQAPLCHTPSSQHSLNTPINDNYRILTGSANTIGVGVGSIGSNNMWSHLNPPAPPPPPPPSNRSLDLSSMTLSPTNAHSVHELSSMLMLPNSSTSPYSTRSHSLVDGNAFVRRSSSVAAAATAAAAATLSGWPPFALTGVGLLKPRFGGLNFAVNICRAVIVGPLTFGLWMFWAFSRRNGNFLQPAACYQKLHRWASQASLQTLGRLVQNCISGGNANITSGGANNTGSSLLGIASSVSAVDRSWLAVPSIRRGRRRSGRKRSMRTSSSLRSDSNASGSGRSDDSSKSSGIRSSQSGTGNRRGLNGNTSSSSVGGKAPKWSKHMPRKPERALYWNSIDLAKVIRIKQVTRSCLNDVILAAVTGAVREYLVRYCSILHPPDIACTLPVDIGNVSDMDLEQIGVNYVLLTSPLPTATEGAIPRLWEIRHLMEELKTSADPAVMHGVHYFLQRLLPSSLCNSLMTLMHRNSSLCVSNLQGPAQQTSIYTHRLHKIYYWMSPPPNVPIAINVYTYGKKLTFSVSTTAHLTPCAKRITKLILEQMQTYGTLLARRRVPGERARLRQQQLAAQQAKQQQQVRFELQQQQQLLNRLKGIGSAYAQESTAQLAARLNEVQLQLYRLADLIHEHPDQREPLEQQLDEYREEFSGLMKQIRRRKSIAEYSLHNIVINVQSDLEEDEDDDEIDGELRPPPRRFSFGVSSRRSSVVSTSAISIPPARFQVSPPNLLSRRSLIASSSSPEPSSSPERIVREDVV